MRTMGSKLVNGMDDTGGLVNRGRGNNINATDLTHPEAAAAA